MIPDPHRRAESPSGGSGGPGGPAGWLAPSRPGLCWLCGRPVEDPPRIIGQMRAAQVRVAHRRCMQVLGELDLNLPFPSTP